MIRFFQRLRGSRIAVCECGDWIDDHVALRSWCRVCAYANDPTGRSSPFPCIRYVYSHMERRAA